MYWGKIILMLVARSSFRCAVSVPVAGNDAFQCNWWRLFWMQVQKWITKVQDNVTRLEKSIEIVHCALLECGHLWTLWSFKSNQMTNATKSELYHKELEGMKKNLGPSNVMLDPTFNTLIQFLFWLVSPDCIMNSRDISQLSQQRGHFITSFLFTAHISSGNHHGAALWRLFHLITATA